MRILLLACLGKNKSGNVFGGAEKSIVNLANWLADKDYDVVLASVEGDARAYDISDKVKYEGKEIIKKNKLYTHYQLYASPTASASAHPIGTDHQMPTTPTAGMAANR